MFRRMLTVVPLVFGLGVFAGVRTVDASDGDRKEAPPRSWSKQTWGSRNQRKQDERINPSQKIVEATPSVFSPNPNPEHAAPPPPAQKTPAQPPAVMPSGRWAFDDSSDLPSPKENSIPAGRGRVKGEVVRHSGDFMPTVREKGEEPILPSLKVTSLAGARVLVFAGELGQARSKDGFFIPREVDTLGKKPITMVTADDRGQFQLDLAPGTYTIVSEIGGKLLHTDGGYPRNPSRTWTTLTVAEGKEVAYKIVDDQTTH